MVAFKRTISVVIAVTALTITATAETQKQVVTRVRGKYPNLPGNRTITLQANKEIASDPSVKGGLFVKTSGNNCGGFSCDLICYPDGKLYDIWGDWDNRAIPMWTLHNGLGDPARCKMQTAPPPEPEPPPSGCEECEGNLKTCRNNLVTCNNQKLSLEQNLGNCQTETKRLSDQLKEWDERLQKCEKDKQQLQSKLDNVKCKASILGISIPCTVIK